MESETIHMLFPARPRLSRPVKEKKSHFQNKWDNRTPRHVLQVIFSSAIVKSSPNVSLFIRIFECGHQASFLCLSGYTIIDKASFAANGNNIAFFWLISIGGDQFAVYKHKTAFNKRNHAASGRLKSQPDESIQPYRSAGTIYHFKFRFRNLFCLLYSGNQNGSMFYPNKDFQ